MYDVGVLEILFKRVAGPPMTSIADFITVHMDSFSFLSEDIEANQTIVVEEDSHPLNGTACAMPTTTTILFCSTRNERLF